MKRLSAILHCSLGVFVLAGCATTQPKVEIDEKPALTTIERYARSASDAWIQLAKVDAEVKEIKMLQERQNGSNQEANAVKVPPGYEDFSERISFTYTGSVEETVQALLNAGAKSSTWTLRSPVSRPSAPVNVSVTGKNQTVMDFLSSIGAQTGARATISADTNSKTVFIVYGLKDVAR